MGWIGSETCSLFADRRRRRIKADRNQKDAESNPSECMYDMTFLGREQREAQQAVPVICEKGSTAAVTNKIKMVGRSIRRLAKRHGVVHNCRF